MSARGRTELFETAPVPKALAIMALPTIMSQLVTLIYNIADTWFIGRTKNPYMVAASSLVLTVFLLATAISNIFGVGGGSLTVRLLGQKELGEAERVASYSLTFATASALAYSLLCLIFMNPLLRLLGASDNTIGYARQYLLFVSVIGGVPTVLSVTMGSMLRNVGFSREAGFGLRIFLACCHPAVGAQYPAAVPTQPLLRHERHRLDAGDGGFSECHRFVHHLLSRHR